MEVGDRRRADVGARLAHERDGSLLRPASGKIAGGGQGQLDRVGGGMVEQPVDRHRERARRLFVRGVSADDHRHAERSRLPDVGERRLRPRGSDHALRVVLQHEIARSEILLVDAVARRQRDPVDGRGLAVRKGHAQASLIVEHEAFGGGPARPVGDGAREGARQRGSLGIRELDGEPEGALRIRRGVLHMLGERERSGRLAGGRQHERAVVAQARRQREPPGSGCRRVARLLGVVGGAARLHGAACLPGSVEEPCAHAEGERGGRRRVGAFPHVLQQRGDGLLGRARGDAPSAVRSREARGGALVVERERPVRPLGLHGHGHPRFEPVRAIGQILVIDGLARAGRRGEGLELVGGRGAVRRGGAPLPQLEQRRVLREKVARVRRGGQGAHGASDARRAPAADILATVGSRRVTAAARRVPTSSVCVREQGERPRSLRRGDALQKRSHLRGIHLLARLDAPCERRDVVARTHLEHDLQRARLRGVFGKHHRRRAVEVLGDGGFARGDAVGRGGEQQRLVRGVQAGLDHDDEIVKRDVRAGVLVLEVADEEVGLADRARAGVLGRLDALGGLGCRIVPPRPGSRGGDLVVSREGVGQAVVGDHPVIGVDVPCGEVREAACVVVGDLAGGVGVVEQVERPPIQIVARLQGIHQVLQLMVRLDVPRVGEARAERLRRQGSVEDLPLELDALDVLHLHEVPQVVLEPDAVFGGRGRRIAAGVDRGAVRDAEDAVDRGVERPVERSGVGGGEILRRPAERVAVGGVEQAGDGIGKRDVARFQVAPAGGEELQRHVRLPRGGGLGVGGARGVDVVAEVGPLRRAGSGDVGVRLPLGRLEHVGAERLRVEPDGVEGEALARGRVGGVDALRGILHRQQRRERHVGSVSGAVAGGKRAQKSSVPLRLAAVGRRIGDVGVRAGGDLRAHHHHLGRAGAVGGCPCSRLLQHIARGADRALEVGVSLERGIEGRALRVVR